MADIPPNNSFLIEIRLFRTKWRIKRTTEKIVRLFSIQDYAEKHPHITLFGPFSLRNGVPVQKLLKTIGDTAELFSAVPFMIDGYDMNQGLNGAVIAYRVKPDSLLTDLNDAISSSVSSLAETVNIWDTDPHQKWYHVTIANRLDRTLGSSIFRQLTGQEPAQTYDVPVTSRFIGAIRAALGSDIQQNEKIPPPPPLLDEDGIRISVINGDRIISEYDLVRHRWFQPDTPGSATEWMRSLKEFRMSRGIELTYPDYSGRKDTYVISDLHLGHANIIRYCSRPFPHDSSKEMDEMLIRNWNYTIQEGDRVYHIGDLCYGPSAKNPAEYLHRLNGTITLIEGNHDTRTGSSRRTESLTWEGIPFTFVHDPEDASPVSDGWIIHGHHHNNDLAGYPFINFANHRINVSAEVVKYRPVSLTALCQIIRDNQDRPGMERILLRED